MPIIRVDCPNAAHGPDQEATLAPPLAQALNRQDIAPVTEIGTAATGVLLQRTRCRKPASGRGSAIRASRKGVSGLNLPNVLSCSRNPVTR